MKLLTVDVGTVEDAMNAARLLPLTRGARLSPGDCSCRALAQHLGVPALSADRQTSTWACRCRSSARTGGAVETVAATMQAEQLAEARHDDVYLRAVALSPASTNVNTVGNSRRRAFVHSVH